MAWPKGRRRSEDNKRRVSETLKGQPKSPSHRSAISDAQRGKKRGRYRKKPDS